MTPREAWNLGFSLDRIRMPLLLHELSIACMDQCQRRVSHVGIELLNCRFNSDALQSVRRQAPIGSNAGNPCNPLVEVRFNRGSMASIWVKVPSSTEYVKVPNIDTERAGMSAHQVHVLVVEQRKERPGTAVVIKDGRSRLMKIADPLLHGRTLSERRRGRKLLGLKEQDPNDDAKRLVPAKRAKRSPKATDIKSSVPLSAGPESAVDQADSGAPAPRFEVLEIQVSQGRNEVS